MVFISFSHNKFIEYYTSISACAADE